MTDIEQYDEQIRDAVKERDALRVLVGSPGWELVNEWLQEEIGNRRRTYEEGAPHTLNDASVIGYQRAQLGMLRTLQDLPLKLLEAQQDAIDQVKLAEGGQDAED